MLAMLNAQEALNAHCTHCPDKTLEEEQEAKGYTNSCQERGLSTEIWEPSKQEDGGTLMPATANF